MEFIATHLWLWLGISVVATVAVVVTMFIMFLRGSSNPMRTRMVVWLLMWLFHAGVGVAWMVFALALVLRIIEYAKHV